jgi:hypothetical protein
VPIISGGGGGSPYTAPITRQTLTGDSVTVATGAFGVLTWNHVFGPNVLLDRTDTAKPAIITSGVYVVAVEFVGTGLTAGGNFSASLDLDRDNEDAVVAGNAPPSVVGATSPQLVLTNAYYIAAGGTIRASVTSNDGAADRGFRIAVAYVQRVS